jgi:hypothetical protein
MKVLTRRKNAEFVAKHYGRKPSARDRFVDQLAQIDALGDHPDPDDVDRIFGDDVCGIVCEECGEDQEEAVCFEADPGDWGKYDVPLCESCLVRALAMLRAHRTPTTKEKDDG